ncbi:MAG: efflux RND transporter periplasmic adaptor subunit [Pseudomonadales bacterium]|nr:efflux RND transporter periplasmic adaptor subunit [Pseudomonadales bacterium]
MNTVVTRIAAGILLFGMIDAVDAAPLAQATVAYQQVESTYDTVATIEAERQSTVSAQTSGRIESINFRAGDRVKAGQVIMRIDTSVADQQMAAAEARVHEADVQRQNAADQFARIQQLLSQHFISQAQYDQAQATLRSAEAHVRSLQADLAQQKTSRGFANIIAPYGGVMASLLVEVGDMAAPGTPLAVGFDPAWLRASAQIPQTRLEAVRTGNKAYLEVPGQLRWIPTSSLTLLPTADPATHTTEARLHLANAEGLLPGQLVTAHFVIGTQRRLIIPLQAVLHRSELTAVYCLHGNETPELRQIRLGQSLPGGYVEVLAGLQAGEQIALDPVTAGARP